MSLHFVYKTKTSSDDLPTKTVPGKKCVSKMNRTGLIRVHERFMIFHIKVIENFEPFIIQNRVKDEGWVHDTRDSPILIVVSIRTLELWGGRIVS